MSILHVERRCILSTSKGFVYNLDTPIYVVLSVQQCCGFRQDICLTQYDMD